MNCFISHKCRILFKNVSDYLEILILVTLLFYSVWKVIMVQNKDSIVVSNFRFECNLLQAYIIEVTKARIE